MRLLVVCAVVVVALCATVFGAASDATLAAVHHLDDDDANTPIDAIVRRATASSDGAREDQVAFNDGDDSDDEDDEDDDEDDDETEHETAHAVESQGADESTDADNDDSDVLVAESEDSDNDEGSGVATEIVDNAVDRDVSDVEAMLDTGDHDESEDEDEDEEERRKKKRTWRKKKGKKRALRKKKKDPFQPEPRDNAKILPSDPFAVPNPPAPKIKAKPQRSILSFDSLRDPLPYADKYSRFKKVVDESDFTGLRNPKDFVREPKFDPVADPLVKAEGRQLPSAATYAFKHPGSNSRNRNLFSHVVDFTYGEPKRSAGRNTASQSDQTWQSGEFKGMGRVH